MFLSKEKELPFQQSLGNNICYLFVNQNVMESYYSSLHHILNVVIYNINIIALVMEHNILFHSDPTLVVTIYHFCI